MFDKILNQSKRKKTEFFQFLIFMLFVSLVNVIIRLMLSLLICPKVITLSGFYCTCFLLFSGAKLEHMIALRDEVELEYADRMEDLREMYRSEMDSQNEKFEAEKSKLRMLEASLQVKKN